MSHGSGADGRLEAGGSVGLELAGATLSYGGRALFDGLDLTDLHPRKMAALRRQQIGFVFQFHYLLPDLSAVENVALPLLIARWKKKRAFDRAMDLLKETGLSERADHPISHLSGGEQQRVAVARALVTEPTLLLADEPTGNLDEEISDHIGRTLVDYAQKHSAITIIATHSANMSRLCDRTLVLEAGRLNLCNRG